MNTEISIADVAPDDGPQQPGQDDGTPGCGGDLMADEQAAVVRSRERIHQRIAQLTSRPVAASATDEIRTTPVGTSASSFTSGDRPAVAPKREAFTRAPDRDHNGSHAWQHGDHGFLAIPGAIPVSCPICEESGFRRRLRAFLNDWKDSGERDPKVDPLLVALDLALNPPRRTQDEINGESLAYDYCMAPGPFLAKFDALAAPRQAAVTHAVAAFLGCAAGDVDQLWVESRIKLAF